MLSVGLTGGIGSGKSAVARHLVGHGAVLIDADAIAREVVEPGTPGLAAVVAEFGAAMLRTDGSLDRAALASVVFADPERLAALNSMTHPLIAARTAELMAAAPADSVVVYDMPLLVENGLAGGYDVVVVVDAPDEVRVIRLVERGLSESDARARMAAQATREQRLAVADHIIDNSGDLGALEHAVDGLWQGLVAGL